VLNILSVLDFCTEPSVLKVLLFIKTILKYVFVIVPIGVMLMTSFDLFKNVIAPKEDDMKKNVSIVIKRFIYCIVIFFVPTIVNLVLNIVNDTLETSYSYLDCLENTKNIEYYEKLATEEKKREDEEIKRKIEEQRLNIKENDVIITTASNNTSTEGSFMGQKYSLTDAQLSWLTKQCVAEQGNNPVGAAAEASLMANLFELNGSRYGKGGDGLYNYVSSGGWFNTSHTSSQSYSTETLTAVKDVLVLGKRTLPLYVDEHDCIYCGSKYGYDIVKIKNGDEVITSGSDLQNRDNYKRNITVIHNRYGSVYTFYTFPTERSDPFGYTLRAKNKFEEWTLN